MAGPFFIPDLSSWQGNLPDFDAIAARPDMVGCIIKSSQGLGPGVSPQRGHALTFFRDNWPRVAAAGGERYGSTWFRGLYHFATPNSSGTEQADHVLATVDRAGGWGAGDLPPAWDLEGNEWTSKQQVIDLSAQFAERIYSQLGRRAILYTGSTWRKFGITDRAGFGSLWTPHMDVMARYGWPNETIVLHQYVGTGKYYNRSSEPARLGYPTSIEGISGIDMNVVLDGGVPATSIERVQQIFTGTNDLTQALPATAPSEAPSAPADRGDSIGFLSTPVLIGIGAVGLLAIGIAIASSSGDDTP